MNYNLSNRIKHVRRRLWVIVGGGYQKVLDSGVGAFQRQQSVVIGMVTRILLSGDAVLESRRPVRGGRGMLRGDELPASQAPSLTPENLDGLRRLVDANPLLLAMEFERGFVKTTILHSLLFHVSQAAEQGNFGHAEKIAELIEHIITTHKNSVNFTKTDSDGNTIFHRLFWYAIKTDNQAVSDRFLGFAKTAMENVAGAASFKKILAQKNIHKETFVENIHFDISTKMESIATKEAMERTDGRSRPPFALARAAERQAAAKRLAEPFLAKMAGTEPVAATTVFDFREGPHKFVEYMENAIQDPITFEPVAVPLTDPVSGATLSQATWLSLRKSGSDAQVVHPYTRETVNLRVLQSNKYLEGFARVYSANSTKDPRELWAALNAYRSQNESKKNPHDRTTVECDALLDAFAIEYKLTPATPMPQSAAMAAAATTPSVVRRENTFRFEAEERQTAIVLSRRCASYIQTKRDSVKSDEGFASFFKKTKLSPVEDVKVHGLGMLEQALNHLIAGQPAALENLQRLIYVKCCLTGHGEDLITKDLFSGRDSVAKHIFFEAKGLLDSIDPHWQDRMQANTFRLLDHGTTERPNRPPLEYRVHHVEQMQQGGFAIYGANHRGELRVLHLNRDGSATNGYDAAQPLSPVMELMRQNLGEIFTHFQMEPPAEYGAKKGR